MVLKKQFASNLGLTFTVPKYTLISTTRLFGTLEKYEQQGSLHVHT